MAEYVQLLSGLGDLVASSARPQPVFPNPAVSPLLFVPTQLNLRANATANSLAIRRTPGVQPLYGDANSPYGRVGMQGGGDDGMMAGFGACPSCRPSLHGARLGDPVVDTTPTSLNTTSPLDNSSSGTGKGLLFGLALGALGLAYFVKRKHRRVKRHHHAKRAKKSKSKRSRR